MKQQQIKDESKEVKECGEGFDWDDELKNIVDSDGYTVASLSNKRNVPFKDYQINGPLLAQSKNMYYALKKVLKDFEQWPCLPSTQRMIEEILLKATTKK